MASFSVSRGRAPLSTIGMYGERKTNARCPCTPPSTVETFGEGDSGFTEEDDDDDEEYDDTKIVKIACERILAWQTGGRQERARLMYS